MLLWLNEVRSVSEPSGLKGCVDHHSSGLNLKYGPHVAFFVDDLSLLARGRDAVKPMLSSFT
jgi:hypothetical protein